MPSTSVAFDKTGTLTEGKPRVTDLIAAAGVIDGDLLRLTAALQQGSEHPLAQAVRDPRRDARRRSRRACDGFKALAGRGVAGMVDGRSLLLGSPAADRGKRSVRRGAGGAGGANWKPRAAPCPGWRNWRRTPACWACWPSATRSSNVPMRPSPRLHARGIEAVMVTGDSAGSRQRGGEGTGHRPGVRRGAARRQGRCGGAAEGGGQGRRHGRRRHQRRAGAGRRRCRHRDGDRHRRRHAHGRHHADARRSRRWSAARSTSRGAPMPRSGRGCSGPSPTTSSAFRWRRSAI